jgi:hypothetical protein
MIIIHPVILLHMMWVALVILIGIGLDTVRRRLHPVVWIIMVWMGIIPVMILVVWRRRGPFVVVIVGIWIVGITPVVWVRLLRVVVLRVPVGIGRAVMAVGMMAAAIAFHFIGVHLMYLCPLVMSSN